MPGVENLQAGSTIGIARRRGTEPRQNIYRRFRRIVAPRRHLQQPEDEKCLWDAQIACFRDCAYLMACATQAPFMWDNEPSRTVATLAAPNSDKTTVISR